MPCLGEEMFREMMSGCFPQLFGLMEEYDINEIHLQQPNGIWIKLFFDNKKNGIIQPIEDKREEKELAYKIYKEIQKYFDRHNTLTSMDLLRIIAKTSNIPFSVVLLHSMKKEQTTLKGV